MNGRDLTAAIAWSLVILATVASIAWQVWLSTAGIRARCYRWLRGQGWKASL